MKLIYQLFFISFLILVFSISAFAEIKVYTHTVKQPFAGSQSPDDARIAAVTKAKREVLEMAGTYLESLTIVKENQVADDQIIALAAGVLKAEIISQKNYVLEEAFGIIVVAKVEVDTSILEKRIQRLLTNKSLLTQYQEKQNKEDELLSRITRLIEQNRQLHNLSSHDKIQRKMELQMQFQEASKGLTAVNLTQKTLSLLENGKYSDPAKAITYLNQTIQLDPANAKAYLNRGNAFLNLKQYIQAIQDYNQALKLEPDNPKAFNNRGICYMKLTRFNQACEDFKKACELGSCDNLEKARKQDNCP